MVIEQVFEKRTRFFQNSEFTNFGDCAEKGMANKKHVVWQTCQPTREERLVLMPVLLDWDDKLKNLGKGAKTCCI